VFTARYALTPYIKQARFVLKGLKWILKIGMGCGCVNEPIRNIKSNEFLDKIRRIS
jgi:hypothetical protein